jgi:hypothetical protein
MKKQLIAYLAVIAVLDMLLIALKPFPILEEGDLVGAFLLIIPIFVSQIGAVWYFLTSVKTFQPRLRVAYFLLVAGLLLFTLAQAQLPLTVLMSVFAPETDPTILQLLLLVPYGLGTLVMYAAMHRFAKLLQIKFLWAKAWFALVFALVLVAASTQLPHPPVEGLPEEQYDLLFALVTWSASFSIAAAVVAWRIRKTIGDAYKQAAGWLALALSLLGAAYIHSTLLQSVGAFVPELVWFTQHSLELILYMLASLAFLRAGQLNKLAGKQYGTLAPDANALDVVLYAAQLASNPVAIESMTETIREITASKQAGQLGEKETAALTDVYLKLEDYLVTQEPLRKIYRDDLRSRLPENFRKTLPSAAEK